MNVIEDLRGLSPRNRAIAVAAMLAAMSAFFFLIRAATEPRLALLYAGLDAATAGEVLEALEGMDVVAEARGDAIYVVENRRDAIRMALASDGLPRQGQAGFELLEDLNAFATTSDMFDATFWRAKEGELARTILSTPGVRSARVHVAVPQRSAFGRQSAPPRAVVTVTMARGRLSVSQAAAMRYVVALAVPDLIPEQVAVIDSANGVIIPPGDPESASTGSQGLADREKALEADLVNLLEARVGPGNARVKVSIEVSHDQETLYERTLDPQKRIITNRESSEVSESGTDGAGVVTVASNLPEGDASASTTPPQSRRNETSETTKFDVSETRREVVSTPGAVRRMHVAVLVNEIEAADDASSAAAAPRTAEELESIRKLVAAAVGFNADRGDVVTIESMAFDPPRALGEDASSNKMLDFLRTNLMAILQLVIPAIVTLILALFVLKPILSSGSTGEPRAQTPAIVAPPAALGPPPATPAPTSVEQMKKIASEQQAASAAVLKNWLDEKERAA